MIEFTPWPKDLAARYRAAGYWLDRPLTRILDDTLARDPDATAIVCGPRRFSYADLDRLARNLAGRLAGAGLGRGDTALVQLPNVAEFHVVFMALLRIGVVPVNALFSHRGREMAEYARQIRPRLVIAARSHELFADDSFASRLRAAGVQKVLLLGEKDPGCSLEHWLTPGDPLPSDAAPTPADQVAFFQLSGGSTGTPKLVPRTHNDYDYSVRESARICGVTSGTRFLCPLPAPHNFALSSPGALGVFHAGGTLVLAGSPDPLVCLDLIATERVTMAPLVPPAVALWLRAVEDDPRRRAQLQTLEWLLVGGASLAESMARRVPQVLGCGLIQVFGMAEGLVNYTRRDDPPEIIFTTQGRPISPDDEIRVLDGQGRPVPDGCPGALAVRGPYTFRGYYRSPEQNSAAFDADGFYHSGDLVVRQNGYLRVVGRIKDQINRGGEKIAAEEVEALLLRHPDVEQAALIAVADPHLGEKSCACLVMRAGARLSAPALRRHLLALGLAEYKLPDRFRPMPELPLTAVGKIDKRRLRDSLAATTPA
ncbi:MULTISPECIES: (2,3-dihydroxybenzoyl)adenylate synthase [unclassified Paracoccus (in: a-proteobacteria)]|uniref:(2,3-dihydroxybenzoyl)adenylate synthase n=1 Tax=unclassified Paracoccus (in: a-proteobacteria) TaxID=2688777 RepID=UPI0012B1D2DC|nr:MULTISPECIES: (2,3-dihydroxybenzoyl)adenylate synthase [unclassified Paracoccus (in: a-proteobacteria)]UXU75517.1 (2,3-dihydroxybenzoyl)adenylate synthase [Paracoccus sp. SMMA_5]UXU81422.1 (2,3-dihydroxybenzoyl)adenylate synthase [Paracoccus sp. SMMA_5_TC]